MGIYKEYCMHLGIGNALHRYTAHGNYDNLGKYKPALFNIQNCIIIIFWNFSVVYDFLAQTTGICVQQVTIFPVSTVQPVTTFTTLSMRGVANLVELPTHTNPVTTRTCGRVLTGLKMERWRVLNLVIISLGFIDPPATFCTVLKSSNVVKCRQLQQISRIRFWTFLLYCVFFLLIFSLLFHYTIYYTIFFFM
jgi:hypothetical protein